MEWSSERIEQLRSLWHDGLSASQIASHLGGITRNAVIGKAHRLGLTGRPSPIKNRSVSVARPRPPRRPRVEHTHAPRAVAAAPVHHVRHVEPPQPVELEDMPGATILTLTDRICKWPIGDPRHPDFHFCGRASARGCPIASITHVAPINRRPAAAANATIRRNASFCAANRCADQAIPH